MRYAALMYAVPADTLAMSDADLAVVVRKHEAIRKELTESGELVGGSGLALPEETTVLRLGGDGSIIATGGPLAADAVEHLTAYYEIDCETVERARAIAARLLDDHVTTVELRRIHDAVDFYS
jgi:hypothetical protein